MKQIHTTFIIIILISYSCKSQDKNLIGKYTSSPLNSLEKRSYKTNKYIKGMVLNLRNDSTYHYNTCGIILEGKWEVKKDSLLLKISKMRFANDSINKIRTPKKRDDFLIYKIENKKLIGFIKEGKATRINKLKMN